MDLVDRFDATSIHVRAASPIILLCGGPVDVSRPKPASLRQAYTLIYGRDGFRDFANVMPEDFKIFAPDGNYQDWLSFESEFAQIVDLIVLFSESYGSVAELGAFAMVDEIAVRLLVVMDDKNYSDPSFVKLGPVRQLEEKYGQSAVCVLDRHYIDIDDIKRVDGINLDTFAEILIAAIATRREDYKERTTFMPGRPGHLIKLIVGLIQHYGALTVTEIDVLLYAMNLTILHGKIQDFLLCATSAKWIDRRRSGVEEYHCAVPNLTQTIEYKVRKDIPVEEKDRERWRARVIEYWRKHDATRFNSIQAVLRAAL